MGENSSQSGDQQQSDPKGKGPSADVNMVFMLLMEFLAPSCDDELEFSDQIAQLALDPMMAKLRPGLGDYLFKINWLPMIMLL